MFLSFNLCESLCGGITNSENMDAQSSSVIHSLTHSFAKHVLRLWLEPVAGPECVV